MKDGFVEGMLLDGRFESISPLNHGSFGMVFLAKDNTNDELVAIKCLSKSSNDSACPASGNDHLLELACHERLGYHPNIVNLIHAFETDVHMYLVLEFCSMGDLYEAIRLGRGPLETEHVREFMLQLVNAVEFMHSKGLYHRDIKPENIFLTQDGSMKLGDFGLSTTETWTYESSVGSDRYMAPEQYDPADNGYCPAEADIWAIGICLLNILFCRNPFVTPSESDVLFADFVRDKQSLFDVFPNMSQDTFEVLVHAMALEPKKRSLAAVREALCRVISFTTDDEVFDDFCTEDREVVAASANRQPLRTPSIQSPPVEQSGAFPWARALHMSPPQSAARQLSAIPDTENYGDDLFPISDKASSTWYKLPEQTPSLASVLDSTLGASIKSMNLREPKPRHPAPTSGSLPEVTNSKPIPALSSVFSNKDNMVSKSWSDLWDEDEESSLLEEEEEDARRRFNGRNWSSETIDEDLTLSVSRPGLVEATNHSFLNSRTQTPAQPIPGIVDAVRISEDRGSVEEDPKTAYKLPMFSPSPTSTQPPPKRSILDKWAALGNRRRAFKSSTVEPEEKVDSGRKRTNTGGGLWRRGFGSGFGWVGSSGAGQGQGQGQGQGPWAGRKERNPGAAAAAMNAPPNERDIPRSRDWRRDNDKRGSWMVEKRSSLHRTGGDGDLEWVGGWHDLHL